MKKNEFYLKEQVKKALRLLVNVSDSRSGLGTFDKLRSDVELSLSGEEKSDSEPQSESESGTVGFLVFCASNWKTYPIGCKSQSLSWVDFSATLMELQSGFRDEKVAMTLGFSF